MEMASEIASEIRHQFDISQSEVEAFKYWAIQALSGWISNLASTIRLDAVGLVALANIKTTSRRTALTGTSCLLDALVIVPGLHTQQDADELNRSEYPACAAMTTGYVFRVENQATVYFLQRVGKTGHLTTLSVSDLNQRSVRWWPGVLTSVYDFRGGTIFATVVYFVAVALTLGELRTIVSSQDPAAVGFIAVLILVRLINILVIRRRATPGWFGVSEPGVRGDLLVLLSQDRWVRIQGLVDDLKAIASGQWLRDMTFIESCLVNFATLFTYFNAALLASARRENQLLILILFLGSTALLDLVNASTHAATMHGKIIEQRGEPKKYRRRLDLAWQLIRETGRDDWAIQMGMIRPTSSDSSKSTSQEPLIM